VKKKRISGKRRRRRSKKADREFERVERGIAEAEARSESEKRQERIKVLWQELKQAGPNRISDLNAENDLASILVELVVLQKAQIEHMRGFHYLCEWAKTHAPEKLDALEFAHFRELADGISRSYPPPKLRPKQRCDRERQEGYNRCGGVGLIEYEFGGEGEAKWRKSSLPGALDEPYEPTCLDDILLGGVGEVKMLPSFWPGQPPIAVDTRVNMRRLQELFGMHRNRFPKNPPHRRTGREILYDWRGVVKIMDALLSEPRERKKPTQGAPRRLWLSDPDLRTRVLSRIAARINSLSVSGDIARRFLEVVRDHLG
jgi:hypothetical protein